MTLSTVIKHRRRERDGARCEVLDAERVAQSARLAWESATQARQNLVDDLATGVTVTLGDIQSHHERVQNCELHCQDLRADAARAAVALQSAQSRLATCEQRLRAVEQLEQRRLEREQRDHQRRAKRAWNQLVMSAAHQQVER